MQERTPLLLLLALSLPAQAPSPQLAHARLEGRVVDPQQRPVVGAMVVAELDGEPLGKTFTDAQGTFVFGKLPARIVVVRATTKTPDVGGAWVDLLGIERGFLRIVTLPARRVAGIVRDDAGQPVAGAWVIAAPNDSIEFAHSSCMAQSDANGRYELSHVAMGPVLVRAWAPGCDPFEGTADGTADVALDPVVERDSVQERRFTLAGAAPEQLAAAELRVHAVANGQPFPLPPPLRRPPRGADGAWIVPSWPDEVRVSLVVPGLRITPLSCRIAASVGRCARAFVLDEAEATIAGTLVARDGVEVGGRHLLVQPLDEVVDNHNRAFVVTRPDGTFTVPSPVARGERFALRVFDGTAVVDASDAVRQFVAHRAGETRAWYVAEHDGPTAHEVRVRVANRVRLTVLAAEGTPAHGAAVAIHPARGRATVAPGLAVPLAAYGSPLAFGNSDLDGRVEILGLDLGAKEELACLVLGQDGFGEVTFQVGDRPDCELGPVQLAPTATLAGTCLDAAGKPIPAMRVSLVANRVGALMGRMVATGRDGRFVVTGLLPGNYAFSMWVEGSPPKFVTLAAGVTEVTLQ